MVRCNKCNREGLSWSKKTLSNGQVLNILLEADGSDHRTKVGSEYVCKGTNAQKPVEGQSQLQQPQAKPEPKVNLNDITDPNTIEKVRNIFKVFRVNAIQLVVSENIGNLFSDHKETPFTKAQEDEIKWVFDILLEISRSRLM